MSEPLGTRQTVPASERPVDPARRAPELRAQIERANRAYYELDAPEIREALIERVEDEVAVIRGEALLALAERKDPRVVPLIRRELLGPFEGDWAVEAAGLTGDQSLLPEPRNSWHRLEEEDNWDFYSTFRDAFQALGESGP